MNGEMVTAWLMEHLLCCFRSQGIMARPILIEKVTILESPGKTYIYSMCVHLLQFRQLVTLPNLRIINYVIGHCGSAHDSTVFHDSRTYCNSSILFNENEWMWVDSAYALDSWCIAPYKRPHTALPENKTFNYHLSWVRSSFHSFRNSSECFEQVRVKSEHAMGYLKGRFSSL